MAIKPEELQRERERLATVVADAQGQFAEVSQTVGEYRQKAEESRKLLWDEYARYIYDFDDAFKIQPQLAELSRREQQERFYRLRYLKLERILAQPYFGRFDFTEEERGQTDNIYIGLGALNAAMDGKPLIYDWRAPVASLYYDFETGRASYASPVGAINGTIALKRQFKIVNQAICYCFDSGLKIDDEMLQEVLSQNVSEGMKTIVTSIQREQNRAIRDEGHRVLLVTGPAGSGKTSIALHRAAYLLYKSRETLRAENIMIFSPNPLFADYISNVLPQLGEENICQTMFQDYLQSFLLKYDLTLESREAQIEWLYTSSQTNPDPIRMANIRFKNSAEFIRLLDRFIQFLTEERVFETVEILGKVLLSGTEADTLFREKLRYLPLGKRLQQIKQRMLYLAKPLRCERTKAIEKELEATELSCFPKELKAQARLNAHQEFETFLKPFESQCEVDPLDCYTRLFTEEQFWAQLSERVVSLGEWRAIAAQTRERLCSRQLAYEDVYPLLYLQGKLQGFAKLPQIKHLIIDEAQDYSLLQYRLIEALFPDCSMTILGDRNQTIHPLLNSDGGTEGIGDLLDSPTQHIRLTKSYRSSNQINRFVQALLAEGEAEAPVKIRDGAKPRLQFAPDREKLNAYLRLQVQLLQEAGMETVALIGKTERSCREIFADLQNSLALQLLTPTSEHWVKGNLVLPVVLAKGLEFDAVIVVDGDAEHYSSAADRRVLYTACSRALHHLVVAFTGKVSPWVERIDVGLYDTGIEL